MVFRAEVQISRRSIMVNHRLLALVSNIETVIKSAEGPVQINKSQCRHLAKCLAETRDYLKKQSKDLGKCEVLVTPIQSKGVYLSGQQGNRVFEEINLIVKRAALLVQGCCNDQWLLTTITHGVNKEEFHNIILDLNWFVNAVFKREKEVLGEAAEADGYPFMVEVPPELLPASQDTVTADQNRLLSNLEAFIATPQLDDELYLAKYLLGRLKVTAEARTLTPPPTLEHVLWELHLPEPKGLKHLGGGHVGSVYETLWLGMRCANKVFNTRCGANFEKEAGILVMLSHPHIVKLFCCLTNPKYSIVMELMDESLFDFMERRCKITKGPPFTIQVAVDIMLQVAKGMLYLHDRGVAHRDLKSPNILVTQKSLPEASRAEGRVLAKVADFELIKLFTSMHSSVVTLSQENVGTSVWRAPEVYSIDEDQRSKHLIVPKRADAYSFAMVCYELVTGRVPFEGVRRTELSSNIRRGVRPSLPLHCPPYLVSLIQDCWQTEPASRPGFQSICKRLFYLKSSLMYGDYIDLEIADSARSLTTAGNSTTQKLKMKRVANYFRSLRIKSRREIVRHPPPAKPVQATTLECITALSLPFQDIQESIDEFRAGCRGWRFPNTHFVILQSQAMAVKQVYGLQSDGEFLAEVEVVSMLKHENVVELVGFCLHERHRLLAYELAPRGSLHDFLHGDKAPMSRPVLDWRQRVKIALGAARGLEYLHANAQYPIIHRCVKSSNVLLFDDYVAKIGEFHFTISDYTDEKHPNAWDPSVAPEYVQRGRPTRKSDVYSFGVVLLELLTGRKLKDPTLPRRQITLVPWAIPLLNEDLVKWCVDPKLCSEYPFQGVAKIAAVAKECVQGDPEYRPDMINVVKALEHISNIGTKPTPQAG